MANISLSSLRLSKDLKYTALYYALGFYDAVEGLFKKVYDCGVSIDIDSENQSAIVHGISSSDITLSLVNHESFVILECLDRLLNLGYSPEKIHLIKSDSYSLICGEIAIRCFDWDSILKPIEDKLYSYSVSYKSRLYSGILEYRNLITYEGQTYEDGIFDRVNASDTIRLHNLPNVMSDSEFLIEGSRLIRYVGNSKKVVIPEGITSLESGLFWDNQTVEEVVMPSTLKDFGGDTFYNCRNLKKVNIPLNVQQLGNNPFAGCPNLELNCDSHSYILKDGVLFTRDGKVLIYYPISKTDDEYIIPEGTQIIGKHAFFLCDSLKNVTLPSTITHMENNPFSGCSHLRLICKTPRYQIHDSVIYNQNMTQVIGALNSIDTDCLTLPDGVKTICRNSFWNCKGLRKIVFPKSLEKIGYNPFVGCENISFESFSQSYKVLDGVLYSEDERTLICYPAKLAVGNITLKDSVEVLERGAFSGCKYMTSVNLKNVYRINKTCFTNCESLTDVVLSDLVTYIGEWAFAHCPHLRSLSVFKGTFIDRNALLNSPTSLKIRNKQTNSAFESDNLFTLESMNHSLKERIKSIVIDPPYNSNVGYIGYQDSDFQEGYVNFMKRRISLGYELLTQDGFMVINIDEDNLHLILNACQFYFSSENIKLYRWKKKHPLFDKNRVILNPRKKQTDYEWIVICQKSEKGVLKLIKQPYFGDGKIKEKLTEAPETFDCFGTTSSAKDEIQEVFGNRQAFTTPKPVKLIEELIRATSEKDSIILDFFAGSGTAAIATETLNRDDGGKRICLLVSNNEGGFFENILKKRLASAKLNYLFF